MEWLNVLQNLSTCRLKKKVSNELELMSQLWNDRNVKKLVYIWLKDHYNKKEHKSVSKAQTFKKMGNNEFRVKNYVKSIQSYTKCALYAPANSCELPIAIANRSAALFYLNRYNDCIKDIELAIKLNYPKQLHYKLYLRAVQCYLKLGKQHLADETLFKIQDIIHNPDYVTPSMKDGIEKKIKEATVIEPCAQNVVQSTNDLLKLKSQIIFKENVNFPNASVTIDKKYNEELGRRVVANKFIKKGDILFLEKPVSFVLLNHNTLYDLCQHCNCSNNDICIPCTTCLNTFYCNENCLTKAWSSYHCWECPGNQMELWKEIGIGHLALKVLLTCTTTTDKIKFNEMQNLVTNFDKLSTDDLTVYGITAIMLTTYLLEYTNFFKTNNLEDCLVKKFSNNSFNLHFNMLTDNNKHLYISSLLLRYILQLICNGHAITKSSTLLDKNDSSTNQQDIIAAGIYPSACMMNHSCDPNIINIFVNDYLIVRASRNIAKDEEIFNCYGPHYRYMTAESRQKILKSQYCFTCKCKYCTLPKSKYFLERFSAPKCLKCDGASSIIENSMHCLDCGDVFEMKDASITENLSKKLLQEIPASNDLKKLEVVLGNTQEYVNFAKVTFYRYHENITHAMNVMGKINKILERWIDSITCLEDTLQAITQRYGSSSIELLRQLNDLTDVCFMYLEKELDTTTDTYKNTLKKTQKYLNQIEEITSFNYGSWSKVYEDIRIKQEKINLFHRAS